MTAKEYLGQARLLDRRIEARIAEQQRLMDMVTAARAPNLTGMPRGGKHDWTDTVDKAVDLATAIEADIRELCRLKREINATIDRVEDYKCRTLLELRYRNGYTWEQIAEVMHYDTRQLHRLHGKALLLVHVPA